MEYGRLHCVDPAGKGCTGLYQLRNKRSVLFSLFSLPGRTLNVMKTEKNHPTELLCHSTSQCKRRLTRTAAIAAWLMASFLGGAKAQLIQYNSCFRYTRNADKDRDAQLTTIEYIDLLVEMTGGAIDSDIPKALQTPYVKARDYVGDSTIPIHGARWTTARPEAVNLMKAFCHEIFVALLGYYHVHVTTDHCISALSVADSIPLTGRLVKDPEYVPFVNALTGKRLTQRFVGLPQYLRDPFDDMAFEGEIVGDAGIDYLMEFCYRTALAGAVHDAAPRDPTMSPTLAPTAYEPSPAPTVTQSQIEGSDASTDEITVEMSDEELSRCTRSMVLVDKNRDDFLQIEEYKDFINGFADDRSTRGDLFEEGRETFLMLYESIKYGAYMPNVYGSKPGQSTSDDEAENLLRICEYTAQAIALHSLSRSVDTQDAALQNEALAAAPVAKVQDESFEKFFAKCKISLLLADSDADNRINVHEYTEVVSRLVAGLNSSQLRFVDLDNTLKEGFRKSSSKGTISIAGSELGRAPSALEETSLRSVCAAIELAVNTFNAVQSHQGHPTRA